MQVGCLKCKGRGYCGREFCPIIAKSQAAFKIQKSLDSNTLSGSSPAPFVGRAGYPFVNVGILSPGKEDSWEYDAPRHWAEQEFPINKIIELRSSLINSRFKADVKATNKMLELSQEVGMASRPVELEIELESKPVFRTNYDASMAPMGPNAKLVSAQITANPKITTEVEKVVGDTDLKANEALRYLHKKGHDENFLAKLLSVGTIGIKDQRKLVPTRWSITAVDDLLGKNAITQIRDYPMDDNYFYSGSYLGNYYFVMTFSEKWSYELFESYLPNASWNTTEEIQFSTDNENFFGRTSYAENCAGGYYAARLSIAEKLAERKRQASVLTIRIITGEYAAPLGVWVCREAARKAMNSKPICFDDKKTMIAYCKALVKRKFGYDINKIVQESVLLKEMKEQTKLYKFL